MYVRKPQKRFPFRLFSLMWCHLAAIPYINNDYTVCLLFNYFSYICRKKSQRVKMKKKKKLPNEFITKNKLNRNFPQKTALASNKKK